MTLSQVIDERQAGGFERRAPSPLAEREDGALCDQSRCGRCGHYGMRFLPFTRPQPFTYRPVAMCPLCGECQEF